MAEILATAAEGKKPFKILDLGSGRGELTRHIAKKIPAAEVLGIELARFPCWQSHVVQRLFGPSNLSYRCLDFWRMDCSEIDAIVFFLTPNFAQRVGEKLAAELKPGSIVISHTFPLLGRWTPAEVIEFRTPFKETLYVYLKS
jgi:SAM-dependent methyltransferase